MSRWQNVIKAQAITQQKRSTGRVDSPLRDRVDSPPQAPQALNKLHRSPREWTVLCERRHDSIACKSRQSSAPATFPQSRQSSEHGVDSPLRPQATRRVNSPLRFNAQSQQSTEPASRQSPASLAVSHKFDAMARNNRNGAPRRQRGKFDRFHKREEQHRINKNAAAAFVMETMLFRCESQATSSHQFQGCREEAH